MMKMNGNLSLRDSMRSVGQELLQLARQELRSVVSGIAPEYRILRVFLLTAVTGGVVGVCALLLLLAAVVLALGEAVPLWAAALLLAAVLGAASALLLAKARRLMPALKKTRPVVAASHDALQDGDRQEYRSPR